MESSKEEKTKESECFTTRRDETRSFVPHEARNPLGYGTVYHARFDPSPTQYIQRFGLSMMRCKYRQCGVWIAATVATCEDTGMQRMQERKRRRVCFDWVVRASCLCLSVSSLTT